MHKREVFVTNSSSCCQLLWGFKPPKNTEIDLDKYVTYMRRTHERYHSAEAHNLPVQIDYPDDYTEFVCIDESVVRIHDDEYFKLLGIQVGEDWDARIIEFCDAVGIPRPKGDELGWYGGAAVC